MIGIVDKDPLAPVAACGDVVDRTRVLHPDPLAMTRASLGARDVAEDGYPCWSNRRWISSEWKLVPRTV